LEDVGAEYGFRERSFDVFVPRLCCFLGSQTKTIAELGLMSADALELSCMIRGGMKVGEKRKVDGVISIADTALATWKVLQRSKRPLEILQPTSVCQSRRASEAQAVDQSIMTALSSKVVSATCALTEICLRILAIDPDYIHIPGEVHYDEDLISRGGSTGKGRACDLMHRELVDDTTLEATGLLAHKTSVDLQFSGRHSLVKDPQAWKM